MDLLPLTLEAMRELWSMDLPSLALEAVQAIWLVIAITSLILIWKVGHSIDSALFMKHVGAETRARRLLVSHLTPAQQSQLKLLDGFYARGSHTSQLYLIKGSGVYTITMYYCLVDIKGATPISDMMLVKKLLIENDEQLFMCNANSSPSNNARMFHQFRRR